MNKHYHHKLKNGEDWEPKPGPMRTMEEISRCKQERIDAMPYGSREEMIKQTGKTNHG